MGLDVYAYKNAKLVDDPKVSETDDLICIYAGYFPEHLCGLVDGAYYDAEYCKPSYSNGYGHHGLFREMLAKLAEYNPRNTPKPDYSDPNFDAKIFEHNFPYSAAAWYVNKGPFKELICFSDCEGVIGTEYCIKLARDFEDYEEKALSMKGDDAEWFIKKYNLLKLIFKEASENGFVQFG